MLTTFDESTNKKKINVPQRAINYRSIAQAILSCFNANVHAFVSEIFIQFRYFSMADGKQVIYNHYIMLMFLSF